MEKLNRDWAALAAKSAEMNAPEGTVYVGKGEHGNNLCNLFDRNKIYAANKERGLLGSLEDINYFVEKEEWKAKTGLKYYVGEEVTVTDAKGNVGPGEIHSVSETLYRVKINWLHSLQDGSEKSNRTWSFYLNQTEDYGLKIEFKAYKSSSDPKNNEKQKEMKDICTKVVPSAAPLIKEMIEKRGLEWCNRDDKGFWAINSTGIFDGCNTNYYWEELSLSEFIAALEKIPEKPQEVEFKEIRGLDIKISKDKIVAGCQTLSTAKIAEIKKAVDAVRNPSVRVNLPDYSLTVDSEGLSVGADYKVSFEQFDKIMAEYKKFN